MYCRKVGLVLVISVSLLAGCGGTGGQGSGKNSKIFRTKLGLTMQDEFHTAINKVVYLKNHYVNSGDSRDYYNKLDVITEWHPRFIFDDEKELGIVAVESRIRLTAKLRQGQASSLRGESTYDADLQGENRVKYTAVERWQPGPITRQCRNYFKDIADDVLQEFKKPY